LTLTPAACTSATTSSMKLIQLLQFPFAQG
jgi:hypothetical protein